MTGKNKTNKEKTEKWEVEANNNNNNKSVRIRREKNIKGRRKIIRERKEIAIYMGEIRNVFKILAGNL
jgi:hypothetical protein